ncbi:MAG: chemotaxis protein CheW [Mariprofundus sp.]|nr:chemotaxis protein CheW [Mariprofundus sp.]
MKEVDKESKADNIFELDAPEGYLEDWAKYLAMSHHQRDAEGHGVILFELADEVFAWPAVALQVTLSPRSVHVLPHRRSLILQGVSHVRGALLPCMSLAHLLGVERDKRDEASMPLLMVGEAYQPWLFSVDKLIGFYRYQNKALIHMPVADEGQGCYSVGMFEYQGMSVSLLDTSLVMAAFGRAL